MVYIEEVIAYNLAINFVLLVLTLRLLGARRECWRVLLCSFVGTMFALGLPFIGQGAIAYKLAALFCTIIFARKYRRVKEYLLTVLLFAAVSFSAGGAAYGLSSLLSNTFTLGAPARATVKYAVIGAIIFLWVVLRQMTRFAARRRISASNGDIVELCIGGNRFSVKCLNDTGNGLVDSVTAKSVAVISREIGAAYISEGARTLEVNTVTASKLLPIITADELTIHTHAGTRVLENIPLAVADREFSDYKLIINFEAVI